MSDKNNKKLSNILIFLDKYKTEIIISLLLIFGFNLLSLWIPKGIGDFIDRYSKQDRFFLNPETSGMLVLIVLLVFVLSIFQSFYSTYLSEKIAFDLRSKLLAKLATADYKFISKTGGGEILTLFTSDISNVKSIASQGIVYLLTAILLLLGSVTMLVVTNLKLGFLAVSILPIIILVFYLIFKKITPLFGVSQKNLSQLNQVVIENILAAGLVRVLNSADWENSRFDKINQNSRDISLRIIGLFSALIPIINLVSNLAIIVILFAGSRMIINGDLTLGQFTSFITYYSLLITPIFILGFTSQGFARGVTSFERIDKILQTRVLKSTGNIKKEIKGNYLVKNVFLENNGKKILNNINFEIKPGTRVAIVGPTGAGKSQLLSLLIGLEKPTSGQILLDNTDIQDWDKSSFLSQAGIVFQDSLVFGGSLKENIVFSNMVLSEDLEQAIYVSKLDEFIETLENGLDTVVSERGADLSGGQKQRLMLARSLAGRPKILLLDDFTARVDNQTETEIWYRLDKTYPDITLVSITQKIESIKDFDQIIVLSQSEILGVGTHGYLLDNCPEYLQMNESQKNLTTVL